MTDRLAEAERIIRRPRRVLVVDDDDLFRQTLEYGFRDSDEIALTHVASGEEAIALLMDKKKFDCVILDLNLGAGRMDGVQVFKHIRSFDKEVPVSFLTGYSDDKRFEDAKAVGWHSVQAKPVNLDELKSMICSLVKREV